MTAKIGHEGELGYEVGGVGGQGSGTANHNEGGEEKKKNRRSGFSIKANTVVLPPQLSLLSCTLPALCVVCVCATEQQCFLQCVGGVISLRYIAPLKSLFKG